MLTPPRPVIGDSILETVDWIRSVQVPNGMIPWFAGGHGDPWNHVEAAMALTVGGAVAEAERAFDWLKATQRSDGAWHTYYLCDGRVEEPRLDTNVCAYVATGVWHHFLATRDAGFLEDMWGTLERAVGFVLSWQRAGGELVWSVGPDGSPGRYGLLTGSSSAYFSLRCALACAFELGYERPEWEIGAGLLRHAVAHGSDGFVSKAEFAMDWYYPVLAGALRPETASARIDEGWSGFVMEQRGVRCVTHKPWVTAAETAECALALASIGRHHEAAALVSWARRHRCSDGSYLTGLVYPEKSTYPPGERSSYTAAAVVLAEDAMSSLTPAAQLFVDGSLPRGLYLDSGAVVPTRLSTRRLPRPAHGSSSNSPEMSARL
jgi:hypothetical protein